MTGSRRWQTIAAPIALGIVALLLWQAAVVGFALRPFVIPAPLAIGQQFGLRWDVILQASLGTARNALVGLVVRTIIGIAVGDARRRPASRRRTPARPSSGARRRPDRGARPCLLRHVRRERGDRPPDRRIDRRLHTGLLQRAAGPAPGEAHPPRPHARLRRDAAAAHPHRDAPRRPSRSSSLGCASPRRSR